MAINPNSAATNNLGVGVPAPDVAGSFGGPERDANAGVNTSPNGRGSKAAGRKTDQIEVMVANHTPASQQEQFTGRGRIVPTPLQPRNLDKRQTAVKLPANF